MKINDETIQQIFSELQKQEDGEIYYCYAVITANAGKMMLLGSLSALANQYFLLGFSTSRLIMVKLDMSGHPKEHTAIPYKQFAKVKISTWMFGIGKKIYIRLSDGSTIK
ncbi:PH domain-containing protein, partial [Ethanoligenens sp.]|uniref:PH domain-containing protein n=1 Tax=Ethanoligenens sp. TaxID=2099655 RepID=UPI0039EBA485